MSVVNILRNERRVFQERLKSINTQIDTEEKHLAQLRNTKNKLQAEIQEVKTVLATLGDTSE